MKTFKELVENIFSQKLGNINIDDTLKNVNVLIIGEEHTCRMHKILEAYIIRMYRPKEILIEGFSRSLLNKKEIKEYIKYLENLSIDLKKFRIENILNEIFKLSSNENVEELKNYVSDFMKKYCQSNRINEKKFLKKYIFNLDQSDLINFLKYFQNHISYIQYQLKDDKRILYDKIFRYIDNLLKKFSKEEYYINFKYSCMSYKVDIDFIYILKAALKVNAKIRDLEEKNKNLKNKEIKVLCDLIYRLNKFLDKLESLGINIYDKKFLKYVLEEFKNNKKLVEIKKKREKLMANLAREIIKNYKDLNKEVKIAIICGQDHVEAIKNYLDDKKIRIIDVNLPTTNNKKTDGDFLNLILYSRGVYIKSR